MRSDWTLFQILPTVFDMIHWFLDSSKPTTVNPRSLNSHLPNINLLNLHLPSFLPSASLLIILGPSLSCGFIDLVEEPRLLQIDQPDLFIASPHPHFTPIRERGGGFGGAYHDVEGELPPAERTLKTFRVFSLYLISHNNCCTLCHTLDAINNIFGWQAIIV